jgi:hypothetical protein
LRCESSSIFFWRSLWAEKSLEIIKEKNTWLIRILGTIPEDFHWMWETILFITQN